MLLVFVGGCCVDVVEPGWFTPPAQKTLLFTPANFGLDYEPFETVAPAGYTIHGWFTPADGASLTVLINHGAIYNREAYISHYSLIHDLGYNVVICDYRGFGESPGAASLDTLIPDADAVLAYVRSRPEPATDRIVLYGISLGTWPTVVQASQAPEGVIGIVLDGSFERESAPATSYPGIGVIPTPDVIESLYAAYPELDLALRVTQVHLPKLFIHSPQDTITPLIGAERLFELAPEPKQWCEVYGGHMLSCVLDPDYAACVAAFLDELAVVDAASGE